MGDDYVLSIQILDTKKEGEKMPTRMWIERMKGWTFIFKMEKKKKKITELKKKKKTNREESRMTLSELAREHGQQWNSCIKMLVIHLFLLYTLGHLSTTTSELQLLQFSASFYFQMRQCCCKFLNLYQHVLKKVLLSLCLQQFREYNSEYRLMYAIIFFMEKSSH